MRAEFYDKQGKCIRVLRNVISKPTEESRLSVVRKGQPTIVCLYVETVNDGTEDVVRYAEE